MAAVSVFDIFKIGVGPSSSHTVGPMKAAFAFGRRVTASHRIEVQLFGSLAWTGRGHGTDRAVLVGLSGHEPHLIDPDAIDGIISDALREDRISVKFDHGTPLDRHTNGMRFTAYDQDDHVLLSEDWFSLGGGFVARGDDPEPAGRGGEPVLGFDSARSLLAASADHNLSIAELVMCNESGWQPRHQVEAELDELWDAMNQCIERGLSTPGTLPGQLNVARRAPGIREHLGPHADPIDAMDWVNAWAIAVNEENAAGGRVVTSPTNGAAGIIPAVGKYYATFVDDADQAGLRRYLLTAGAIGALYKINASISGAEMGCQGEVGVACSMAAGGLVAALGGTNEQVEQAAEIGMEHNLGLTCDPIEGLVQIPCIERNAMGAVKAINAARLARHGDGTHKVSLDQVIETMRQTGLDMTSKYKETSQGGLAVNVVDC